LTPVVFSRKGFPRKNRVSCSILVSHYLLTSDTRAWYEFRLKKGFLPCFIAPPPFAEHICYQAILGDASLLRASVVLHWCLDYEAESDSCPRWSRIRRDLHLQKMCCCRPLRIKSCCIVVALA
jgi:hypothetical protein